MTALVGTSGKGKSTCVSLLQRFYEQQDGEILLDNEPLKSYDHRFLHKKVIQHYGFDHANHSPALDNFCLLSVFKFKNYWEKNILFEFSTTAVTFGVAAKLIVQQETSVRNHTCTDTLRPEGSWELKADDSVIDRLLW